MVDRATPRQSEAGSHRLLVMSNRGPVELRRGATGRRVVRTVGGLALALDDVLRERNGTWIAWNGTGERIESAGAQLGYGLRGVRLKEREINRYYIGFANQVLWPLCHSFPGRCRFDRSFWNAYRMANEKFAAHLTDEARRGDRIWIHDFHLALVPALARAALPAVHPIGMFWHIPFPPAPVFSILPWREELLAGMLGCDLIGFQTDACSQNFLDSVASVLGLRVAHDDRTVPYEGRSVRVATLPIGIDCAAFERLAREPATEERARRLRQQVGGRRIVLGVDRLDYTKGILERLHGFERLLERIPEYRRSLCLVQIAVPSRTRVEDYRDLKRQVEETVGRITGRFTADGQMPVRYLYTSLSREQLVPYYVAADVCLITALRDGMNLVAKEFAACRVAGDGALVLSEFAGAASELPDALLVNPYDREAIADTLRRALEMSPAECRGRMRILSESVRERDIRWWTDRFVQYLDSAAGGLAGGGSRA